jgi:hypothetical protein
MINFRKQCGSADTSKSKDELGRLEVEVTTTHVYHPDSISFVLITKIKNNN